ncbi:aminopeptidase Ey-like [Bombina bombina]|uniref:aminopeptidase Ey-like n=1 Tax=Bombina bombina TaxID=8345 RepID=UPI00235A98F7|nr:aminopeptidase Ey-like [Bombina bombina]XP_053573659.1 aminopeptidase Ey-like [Bombina bombina]
MAKGFYVSKLIAVVGIIFCVAAVSTIIALAVVYSQEKAKNNENEQPPVGTTTSPTTTHSTVGTGSTLSHATTTPVGNEIWHKIRLPTSLVPHHYDIELKPYLEKNSEGLYIFEGKSTVFFLCKEATNLVVIHSNKLNYTLQSRFHAVLKNEETGSNVPLIRTFLEVPTQYLVVQVDGNLQPGKNYSLHTVFKGELADDLAGFYRSEYVEDGVTKIIATTQMQAPDARKSFPCFDEPAMKATFSITLIHKSEYKAISNMPAISSTNVVEGGQTWNITAFEKTPKMSTYLLAFIVSDFDYIEAPNNGSQVQVQIWGRKKVIKDQGQYALNVTRPILQFFEDYYKTKYPLPKSDQIALPDFSAGAMENWGLVTYRETALLFDELESSIGNKERVVTVIAHELAHQWFGNLVTVRWWNDLWLNEGFASYVEYLGADYAEPTWNIKDLIVLNDVHRVMAVDALTSSHPLTSREDEVNTPAEISELFDSIAYSKGASVIRMLSEFLTEDIFVKGLAKYLNAFAYDNTVYSDLWFHLQNAVDEEPSLTLPLKVSEIMDTWVLQMGFPVVTIDTTTGNINQKHFLLDPDAVVTRPSPYNYVWKVPVSYTINNSPSTDYWLLNAAASNSQFRTSGNDWLIANINVTGYFRVNYDDGNWNKILTALQDNPDVIPLSNRAQIIDDAFNLARAKYISTTRALDTTKFLSKEVEYMPWQAALGSLSYFLQMFDRTEVYGPMKNYMRQQVTPLFEYFKVQTSNWTVRPHTLTEQYNEINAVSTACGYGVAECGQLAANLLKNWMNTGVNGIHPNLRTTIYCNAIAQGGEEEWNFIWEQFNKTDNAQEADKLRAGLACGKEPWILNRLLEYSLDSNKIRKQDTVSTITNIANNVIGQSLAWDFVRANWKTIFENFGGSSFSFGNLIQGVSRRFSTDFDLQQLEQFKLDNQDIGFGTATRSLEQAIEKTKANIRWVKENKESVLKWFNDAIKNP